MGPQMLHFTTLPNGFPKWLSQGRTSSPSYTSPVFSSLKFLLISILWCSLGKTLLAFALLFFTPRSNLPITPGISWLPTFAFQSPIMKRTSFFGVSFKIFVGLHRTIQLQLLQRYLSGHRLGSPWYWMVSMEMNRDHSVVFETASKYCISDSLVDSDGYSISSKGFLP